MPAPVVVGAFGRHGAGKQRHRAASFTFLSACLAGRAVVLFFRFLLAFFRGVFFFGFFFGFFFFLLFVYFFFFFGFFFASLVVDIITIVASALEENRAKNSCRSDDEQAPRAVPQGLPQLQTALPRLRRSGLAVVCGRRRQLRCSTRGDAICFVGHHVAA